MKQYVDLQLSPNDNFVFNTLMNFVFSEAHMVLVETSGNVGISFPRYYNKGLGETLRFHGTKEELATVLKSPRINKIKNYIKIGGIQDVPANTQYCTFQRVRSKGNLERRYRRSVRNGKITKEEAQVRILNNKTSMLDLPYIQTQSLSTKQPFKLFIERGRIVDNPNDGKFSCYGLSNTKTVPWF